MESFKALIWISRKRVSKMEGSFSENTVSKYNSDNVGSEEDLFTRRKNQSSETEWNKQDLKTVIK